MGRNCSRQSFFMLHTVLTEVFFSSSFNRNSHHTSPLLSLWILAKPQAQQQTCHVSWRPFATHSCCTWALISKLTCDTCEKCHFNLWVNYRPLHLIRSVDNKVCAAVAVHAPMEFWRTETINVWWRKDSIWCQFWQTGWNEVWLILTHKVKDMFINDVYLFLTLS